MKTCSQCSYEAPAEALFCPACGNSFKAAADPLIGMVVAERYRLIERIGQGGSGVIYRGEHTALRKKVAVKVLHQQLAEDEAQVERFRREASTVCEIENEHILQVLDFGRIDDGRFFFAMELLEGEPLSSLIQREGALPLPRVCAILTQTGEALMEAHALGYVHRDLRPRNIYLSRRRGRADFVKLLDFGLSKLADTSESGIPQSGLSFGDAHYLAPEQLRGETIDRRTDLYALGVMAYEMLTGRPPFDGEHGSEIIEQHLSGPIPGVRALRADCPEWLEQLVQRALAKSPDQRFVTVLRMLECLKSEASPKEEVVPAEVSRKFASTPSRGTRAVRATPVPGVEVLPGEPVAVGAASPPEIAPPTPAAPSDLALAEASAAPKAPKGKGKKTRRDKPSRPEPESWDQRTDVGAWWPPEPRAAGDTDRKPTTGQQPLVASSTGPAELSESAPRQATVRVAPLPSPSSSPQETQRVAPLPDPSVGKSSPSGAWRKITGSFRRITQSGEHDQWFDETTQTGDEEFAEPQKRRNLPLIAGVSAGAVVALGGVLLVLFGGSSAKPKAAMPPRSFNERAVSASLEGKVAPTPTPTPTPALTATPTPAAPPPPTPALPRTPGPVRTAVAPPLAVNPKRGAVERLPGAPPPARPEGKRDSLEAIPEGFRDPFSERPSSVASADGYLKAGRQKLNAGDVSGAIGQFSKAREIDGRSADALAGLGECAFEQSDYDGATAYLKQAVRIAPNRSRYLILLGQSYYKLGRFKEAVTEYRQALKFDPHNKEAAQSLEVAERKLSSN